MQNLVAVISANHESNNLEDDDNNNTFNTRIEHKHI